MRIKIPLFALVLAALTTSCGNPGYHEYNNSDLQLITGYAAKEYCSCIFVMEQSEEWCTAWTKANPQVDSVRLDRASKSVEASALMMWAARAHYVDEHFGCVIE